jgi:hypothetical protein
MHVDIHGFITNWTFQKPFKNHQIHVSARTPLEEIWRELSGKDPKLPDLDEVIVDQTALTALVPARVHQMQVTVTVKMAVRTTWHPQRRPTYSSHDI